MMRGYVMNPSDKHAPALAASEDSTEVRGDLVVLSAVLHFIFSPPPLSRGVPGEGPDCYLSDEIGALGRFRPGSGG